MELSETKLMEIDLTIRFCHLVHTLRMEGADTDAAFLDACEKTGATHEDGKTLLKILSLELSEIIQEVANQSH